MNNNQIQSGEPTPQQQVQGQQQEQQGQVQGQEQAQQVQEQQQQQAQAPQDLLQQVTQELEQLKQQNAALQAQLAFFGQQAGGEPTPQIQQQDPFEGLEDDDVLTVADVKRLMAQVQRPAVDPNLYKEIQMLKLSVQEPNWQDVIKNYLPDMINSNPLLGQMIQNAPNPLEAALHIAKLNPRYQQQQQAPQQQSQQIINQLINKPASPDQFGGGGGVSKADKIAAMSDEEFEKYVQDVLSGKV